MVESRTRIRRIRATIHENGYSVLGGEERNGEEEEDEQWTRLREEAAAARASGCVPLGEVYLVGAGPGDPSLLTLRAASVLARADVVLRDRLISDDILEFVNKRARIEYVGKKAGFHTRTQEQIHELLYIFAETGKTVVRLKVRREACRPCFFMCIYVQI